jgi:23S rRNA (cytosine1962-C5)-methyltransferase
MELGQVCLKRGEERDLRAGALWVYDNEIDWIDENCKDGEVVDIIDSRRRFVARGYFNSASRIAARVLTLDRDESIDRSFFLRRIAAAKAFRESLGFSDSYRVVFGESDGLPGLTVDKFGDCLSFQITALGMERWKQEILDILVELYQPAGIFERNDVPVREKEGLPQIKQCVYGTVPARMEIREHDARMYVDIAGGQKTGHFLDQQENRGRLKPYVAGKSVLDLCCCTGGFSIHAALYGASHVEAVDASEDALALVRENAALNGVSVDTTCANVFDLVKAYSEEGRQYDVVILDPPAFAKSRRALDGAYRGYKELNLRCMKLVRPGGFLFTFSCSQFMTPELFHRMIAEAAADTGSQVRLLENLLQSRDHPARIGAEHALYLKGCVLQIV